MFEKSFSKHVDLGLIPAEERAQYVADWSAPGGMTAMLNWYRGSKVMPSTGIVGIDIDAEPARVRADVVTFAREASNLLDVPFDEASVEVVAGHA